ncbi:hypothetical protein ABNQ39_07000 [Azospirillum sp. A26]|uniref:hypothetical protein n=1 Tax=Azospirillum sp. A26 TaxID=3160607 RepID=UPI00366F6421
MEALTRLKRVVSGEATADDLGWLSARLGAYLTNPERGMEHAFRLNRSAGEIPWWRLERRQRRDALILRLWRERFPTSTAWVAAEQILAAQQRYATSTWQHDLSLAEPPDDPTAALLWEAMRLEEKFPTSHRRIFEILNISKATPSTEIK